MWQFTSFLCIGGAWSRVEGLLNLFSAIGPIWPFQNSIFDYQASAYDVIFDVIHTVQRLAKMAAIANPWFRVLPPEPVNDPPFNGAPTGPVHMPPRNASPISYFYLSFPIDLIKEFVRQTNRLVKP